MDRLANDLRRARLLVRSARDDAAVRFLIASRAYRLARDSALALQRRVGFAGEHTFTDRRSGRTLVSCSRATSPTSGSTR